MQGDEAAENPFLARPKLRRSEKGPTLTESAVSESDSTTHAVESGSIVPAATADSTPVRPVEGEARIQSRRRLSGTPDQLRAQVVPVLLIVFMSI